MKNKKWQGITCLILASLMVSPNFAASVRKEVQPPSAKEQSTPEAPDKSKSTLPTDKKEEKPNTLVTPSKDETPKSTEVPTKKEVPKPIEIPSKKEEPKPIGPSPLEQEPGPVKIPNKEKEAPNTIKKVTPSDNSKKCKKPGVTEEADKPFALDHFKMILNTLKKMGVEEKQIIDYLKQGKKLEDILKSEKISARKFKKCIIKEYYKEVDKACEEGKLTSVQAKELKCSIKKTIKEWLPKM